MIFHEISRQQNEKGNLMRKVDLLMRSDLQLRKIQQSQENHAIPMKQNKNGNLFGRLKLLARLDL